MTDSYVESVIYNESLPYETRKQTVDGIRQAVATMFANVQEDGRVKKVTVPARPEFEHAVDMELEIVVPADFDPQKTYPAIFYIPAGGLYMNATGDNRALADEYGAIVVVASYRTTFEEFGRYPYVIDQLHSEYAYITEHAAELNIDPDNIVIHGTSSGGHLGLALPHRLKISGFRPRGCVVCEPIADDRTIYPSSNYSGIGWTGNGVALSSKAWLGDADNETLPAEAFANRASVEECIGLPPTVIFTRDGDPCVDPCLIYASKLIQACVYTSIHVHGGLVHGDLGYGTEYIAHIQEVLHNEIANLFKHDLRR